MSYGNNKRRGGGGYHHNQNQNRGSFWDSKKQRGGDFLQAGARGFLCTCNFQEKQCVREACNLLEEYDKDDETTVDGEGGAPEKVEEEEEQGEVEEDVSDALRRQIDDMKQKESKGRRRFRSLQTGATNCVFVQADVPDPVRLAVSIVEDIARTKAQRTRFLLRLIPIEAVCSIKLDDVKATAGRLIDAKFAGEPTTFCILFNKRMNNSPRDVVIKELADLVCAKNAAHKVDLQSPKLTFIVEMIKGHCLMSVVPDYYRLKKYNLAELCAPPEDKKSAEGKKEGEGQEEEAATEDAPTESCENATENTVAQ